jgi:hypothetical protein
MEVRQWAADMLRQNQIWIASDRILRFPAWLLRTDPSAVGTQLRAALETPVDVARPDDPGAGGARGTGSPSTSM